MISNQKPKCLVDISVVAPAHNEAENLPQLLLEISNAMTAIGRSWEIILVNDASTDGTAKLLPGLMAEYRPLRVLFIQCRSGQTAALAAGFCSARGCFIATIDADLQNDPADIPEMMRLLTSGRSDFVNGWRRNRHDSRLRLLSSRVSNAVRRKLTGAKIRDAACGLKVFRRECIEEIKLFDGMHRFLVELVRMEGFRVIEVPINHRPRIAGKSKYGIRNRAFKALKDALAVRWMQNRRLRYEFDEWER